MAAKTPASVYQENAGSMNILKVSFTDIDDGDTWASGLGSTVWGFFVQPTDDPTTQANAGCAVANSSGTFTFYPAEDDKAVDLYVFVKA